ncbi:MAG: ABC transporter ATP-binding protein [Betaproteobacteria bacterium]|nr:MAG: ABC transporter ATP-binding protein [Betaproteobacteria bacterium]
MERRGALGDGDGRSWRPRRRSGAFALSRRATRAGDRHVAGDCARAVAARRTAGRHGRRGIDTHRCAAQKTLCRSFDSPHRARHGRGIRARRQTHGHGQRRGPGKRIARCDPGQRRSAGCAEGETVALMGRNGVGKTTLIRSMLGHVRPRTGSVRIAGRDATRLAPYRIARLGVAYVPEGRGVFPNLSVIENLVMAARPGDDRRTGWTLERVLETFPRLSERLQHRGMQLSGGEQQMLTLGRALMTNPKLLVLDEATEGLAPLIAQEIWHTIRVLRDAGTATIIVDKNFAVLSHLAHRCVILVKGRKVFDGPPAELSMQPGLRRQYLGI